MTRGAVAERIGIPHYVARLREPLQGKQSSTVFAESYVAGETPVPLHRVQPVDQVFAIS